MRVLMPVVGALRGACRAAEEASIRVRVVPREGLLEPTMEKLSSRANYVGSGPTCVRTGRGVVTQRLSRVRELRGKLLPSRPLRYLLREFKQASRAHPQDKTGSRYGTLTTCIEKGPLGHA